MVRLLIAVFLATEERENHGAAFTNCVKDKSGLPLTIGRLFRPPPFFLPLLDLSPPLLKDGLRRVRGVVGRRERLVSVLIP